MMNRDTSHPTSPPPWPAPDQPTVIIPSVKASHPKPWRDWLIIIILIALGIGLASTAVEAGLTVRDLEASINSAQAHLKRAEAFGAQLSHNPFDNYLLMQTRSEITASEQDFLRAQADTNRLAPLEITPKVGLKVQDARALLEMAVVLTDGGQKALTVAIPVLQALKAAMTTQQSGTAKQIRPQAGSPLTTAQLVALQQAIETFAGDITQAQAARQRIPDGGATLGASAARLVARYDQLEPTLSAGVDSLRGLLAAAPALLGTDHPASYLIEILDDTELRAGGGFIGNYGVVTVTAGHLTNATVRDTYLLDGPYLASHSRAFPSQYRWFPLTTEMGLRDSNLSPDFPQNAQVATQIYQQESGQSVTGVIAITPAFIAQLLTVTGPVAVPGYGVTVTSQNLVATIHHYQFQTNAQGVPSSDGISSTRKRFTAILGETVFARLRTLPANDYSGLLKLAQNGLKSKDVQLYVNQPGAETTLERLGLANALVSVPASDDMVTIVDDNIGSNKANLYVTQTAADNVAISPDGTVRHTLTLVYTYRPSGPIYGDSTTFVDEAQVYVPQGSVFSGAKGLDHVDTPYHVGAYMVFGGAFSVLPFTSRTFVLKWTAPKLTTHTYHLAIERQAGSLCSFSATVLLPASSSGVVASPPLTLSAGQARYATEGSLVADLHLDIVWR